MQNRKSTADAEKANITIDTATGLIFTLASTTKN